MGGNGSLMLLCAYLISLNPEWDGVNIRVIKVIDQEAGVDPARANIESLFDSLRLSMTPMIIPRKEGQSIKSLMQEHSSDADLVIGGLADPSPETEEAQSMFIAQAAETLGTVLFVRSSGVGDLL
jgi:hypothetical protein